MLRSLLLLFTYQLIYIHHWYIMDDLDFSQFTHF